MPGNILLRPLEANITHNTDLIGKMNPYCSFILGTNKFNSEICKKGGKHPQWNDVVTIPFTNETTMIVELMDKDKITKDDVIGGCSVNLIDLQATGARWYPLFYKNKPAGEILLEATIQGDFGFGGSQVNTGFVSNAGLVGTTGLVSNTQVLREQELLASQTATTTLIEEAPRRVFTEQHQVVEPRTFMKNVEVTETVPVQKTIEVLEPRKVLKDVEYTQAVPVTRQIEVVEPQVVMKEVEVIEPRVVTKTIQVVENVPVMKQVEVVEMRHTTKNVETFEPQTFHKQVEVTEQVPVMRTVTVSEPVTVQKTVEFVEPVITTQTITKEVIEPVVVNQSVRTEVGPATLVGVASTGVVTQQAQWNTNTVITQQQPIVNETVITQQHVGAQQVVGQTTYKEQRTDKAFLDK